jgi:hypothetical protein
MILFYAHWEIKGDWHLNASLQSKIIAMVFAMASEIECNNG